MDTIEILLRLALAGFLGAAIGMEREYRAKDAGHRTHFLVALGSAFFMTISQYGFADVLSENTSFDPSRIASQVVTGIGFLGAGTIFLQRHYVKGLTTAAGIWTTSAIGLGIGAGMYIIGILTTAFVLIGLETMHLFSVETPIKSQTINITLSQAIPLDKFFSILREKKIDILSYEMHRIDNGYQLLFQLKDPSSLNRESFCSECMSIKEVTSVSWKTTPKKV